MKNNSKNLISGFIVNNPIKVIDEALESKSYFSHFSAFTLACSFIEYLSYVTLRKKGVDISDYKNSRRGPSLYELTRRLETEGIIESETLKSLDEIRDIRNKIVHPKDDISSLYQPRARFHGSNLNTPRLIRSKSDSVSTRKGGVHGEVLRG